LTKDNGKSWTNAGPPEPLSKNELTEADLRILAQKLSPPAWRQLSGLVWFIAAGALFMTGYVEHPWVAGVVSAPVAWVSHLVTTRLWRKRDVNALQAVGLAKAHAERAAASIRARSLTARADKEQEALLVEIVSRGMGAPTSEREKFPLIPALDRWKSLGEHKALHLLGLRRGRRVPFAVAFAAFLAAIVAYCLELIPHSYMVAVFFCAWGTGAGSALLNRARLNRAGLSDSELADVRDWLEQANQTLGPSQTRTVLIAQLTTNDGGPGS